MWSARSLVVLTQSYPFDSAKEVTFIEPELPYLLREFGSVTLLPASTLGLRRATPASVTVDDSLAKCLQSQVSRLARLLRVVRSPAFYVDLHSLLRSGRRRGVRASAAYLSRTLQAADWFSRRAWPIGTLLYSYWSDEVALGALLGIEGTSTTRLVSRAHGYDLFETRSKANRIPLRRDFLAKALRVYSVSDAGKNFLVDRYGADARHVEVARLGVEAPVAQAAPSDDGVLRIVSCSALIELKRVHLIVRALRAAASIAPHQHFEWHHFGDGGEMQRVRAEASTLPSSILVTLHGHVSKDALSRAYVERPIDLFLNVSSTEGVPVSIMEAQSHGIPVVATDVGGTGELVDASNGLLVRADVEPEEIARALLQVASDRRLRSASRHRWEQMSDASQLHARFAKTLKALTA